ncbi:hypothetical protein X777_11340 [Ooceraea biroi]|uniref:Uncharacterized protein n=1 Tax=Ooceraea biroi TaxID=2015173 RepID=A0A026W3L7_OOCBI|nr:hypothetical protein X777_11340 [Ooceraea biroi]
MDKSTVEIIPSSWVESGNQTALWPKDTLANAEKKAQKAEDTSQLSSDSDSQTFLPLKRSKKPSRFNISLSDKESVLNEPLIQSKKRTQKFGNTDSANVSTPPVVPPFPESQESFNEIDNSLANSEEDFVSLIKYLNLAFGETVNHFLLKAEIEKEEEKKDLTQLINIMDLEQNLKLCV